MKMRKFVLVLSVFVAVCLVVSGCQAKKPTPVSGSAKNDVIRLAIAPQAGLAPIYLGEKHGFYEEEGITLELTNFNAMAPAIAALISGDLDISFMGLGVHPRAVIGDIDILILCSLSLGDYVIGNKKMGITDLESLKKTTVALPKGSTAEMTFNFAVKKGGYNPADFNVVNMDVPGTTAAMISGQIAACALYMPYVNDIITHIGPENIHIFGTSRDYLDEVAFPGSYGATRKFINANQDLIVRFLRAYTKSADYVNSHYEETIDYVVERTGAARDSIKANLDATKFFSKAETKEMALSGANLTLYKNAIDAMNAVGATDAKGDPKDYVNNELILKALADVK